MSVLIRGMSFPNNCAECALARLEGGDHVCPFGCVSEVGRQSVCPLVEIKPHGDLVDKQKLVEVYEDHCHSWGFAYDYGQYDIQYDIEHAPVVIGRDDGVVKINVYDKEEIYEDCTVQILKNSVTGDVSVGWWKNEHFD